MVISQMSDGPVVTYGTETVTRSGAFNDRTINVNGTNHVLHVQPGSTATSYAGTITIGTTTYTIGIGAHGPLTAASKTSRRLLQISESSTVQWNYIDTWLDYNPSALSSTTTDDFNVRMLEVYKFDVSGGGSFPGVLLTTIIYNRSDPLGPKELTDFKK